MPIRRIGFFQFVVAVTGAAISFFFFGEAAARAVFFGGAVALANSLLLAWRMHIGALRPGHSPGQELARLVRSSVERFLMVALLIAAGLGWLKLMPAALLAGFVLGQLTLVVSAIISGIEKR